MWFAALQIFYVVFKWWRVMAPTPFSLQLRSNLINVRVSLMWMRSSSSVFSHLIIIRRWCISPYIIVTYVFWWSAIVLAVSVTTPASSLFCFSSLRLYLKSPFCKATSGVCCALNLIGTFFLLDYTWNRHFAKQPLVSVAHQNWLGRALRGLGEK